MTRGAGGQPGVRVGGGGAVGVGDLVGPAGGPVGRDLDLVAGDGGAAGARRGAPGEVDRGGPAGRGREAGRGAGGGGGEDGDGRVVDDGGDAVQAGGEGGGLVAEDVLEGDRVVPGGGIGIGEGDRLALDNDAGQADGQLIRLGTGGGQPADRDAGAVGRDGEGGGQARQERERFGLVRGQDHVLVEHQRDGVAGGADRGADKRGPLGFQLRANHLYHQRPAVRVFDPAGPVMVEESVGEAPAVRRHILAIGGDGP